MKALLLVAALAGLSGPDSITIATTRGTRRIPVRTERGFPALSSAQLGALLPWEAATPAPGTVTLRVAGESFVFMLGAGYFRNGDSVYTLAASPYLVRDSLFMPLQFIAEYLPRLTNRFRYDAAAGRLDEIPQRLASGSTARPAAAAAAPRRRTVAIDAGHGGVDFGMTGPIGGARFLREKDVTLAISRFLAAELHQRGYGTFLTRDRDSLVARDERGGIARRAGADVFVSVHVNASNPAWRNARSARGFETYYLAEARTEDEAWVARLENASIRFETDARARRGDPLSFIIADLAANEHLRESSQMAELVQQSLGRIHPGTSRGVKQAPFAVLSTSYMPAILVETGFGSNAVEARYLTSSAGQQQIARAIAEGVVAYFAEYERRVGQ